VKLPSSRFAGTRASSKSHHICRPCLLRLGSRGFLFCLLTSTREEHMSPRTRSFLDKYTRTLPAANTMYLEHIGMKSTGSLTRVLKSRRIRSHTCTAKLIKLQAIKRSRRHLPRTEPQSRNPKVQLHRLQPHLRKRKCLRNPPRPPRRRNRSHRPHRCVEEHRRRSQQLRRSPRAHSRPLF
jgi:hypothetical protein